MAEDERREEQNKIIGYARLRPPLTFMTVVFALILIYLLVHGILLLTRDRIQAYDVGAPVKDNVSGTYMGIILRDEHMAKAEENGYVSCFSVSGDRLSSGATVCTLDEDGMLEEELRNMYFGEKMLSEDSKVRIRDTVRDSMYNYSRMDFSTATEIGTSIRASVLNGLIRDADSTATATLLASCTPVAADESGFVLFTCDGYENAVPASLTLADFSKSPSAPRTVTTGTYVNTGDFLYKIVPDNRFRLVFPMTEDEAVRFSGRKQLTVRFLNGVEITGSFSSERGADGTMMGILTFQKYGANHLNERRVSFYLLDTSVQGYKIPESAIITKNFYTVDKGFITEGGGGSSRGVLIETKGKPVFHEVTVYMSDSDENDANDYIIGEDVAYISGDCLSPGTVLIRAASENDASVSDGDVQKSTVLGVQTVLEGVYQINSGYCVFKPVARLSSSLETSYVMVSTKVRNGISDYDRIVMNAAEASEYELIYR